MFRNIVYRLFADRHREEGIEQLSLLEKNLPSRESRFAIPFVYRGKGIFKKLQPRQNPVEIESLYREVCRLHPQRILEIGTARGGTLYLWTQAAADDAVIVSVDLPGGEFGGAYDSRRIPFYESFRRDSQKMHLLRRDSHDRRTLEMVTDIFGGEPVDFIFIDGDHSYEGVKKDFEFYGPLAKPGGLVAFHDILSRQDRPAIQVSSFWQEIRNSFDSQEFIGPESSGRSIGIGLVRVGGHGLRLPEDLSANRGPVGS